MRNRAKLRAPACLLALGVPVLLCACVEGGAPGSAGSGPMDVVIEGGRVVDGTGAAWFHGDVGIRGDRIAAVTPAGGLASVDAATRVDASGKVVAPGFIDILSHARGPLLNGDGRLLGKITQGITTEIMGEGWTNAPANANTDAGAGLVDPEAQGERHDFSGPRGFDAWLNAMLANGASPNFGSFVGATTVRVYAMGEAAGPANEAQLDSMRKATRWAMEGGAFGVASALIYPPGNFASTEELGEVVAASAPYGGVYITHMRSEADRFLEAIDEAIEIGERGGVPVEIYHLKAAGVRNYHKAALAIAKIDSARAAGFDVQANMYPYTAGGTGLPALLPPWASEDGALLDNLRDPEIRQRIHDEVLADTADWENLGVLSTPEGVMITSVAEVGPDGEPSWRERLRRHAGRRGRGADGRGLGGRGDRGDPHDRRPGGHDRLHDGRGQRRAAAAAALDQDRDRRFRLRPRQRDRDGPPPVVRHLSAHPGQVRAG